MTEQIINPFDSANFKSGGGFWDDKVVTITKAFFGLQTDNNGNPFTRDGQTSDGHGLHIYGISEGSETPRRELYSLGQLKATIDGEGYTKADGSGGVLHKSSNAAKFFDSLKLSGFDMGRIFVDGKQKVSGLVGAKILFVGVDKLDKEGNVIVKKGYTQQGFFPQTTVGYVGGGNGAVAGNGLDGKLRTIVSGIITSNGGSISRTDLVKAVSAALKGDADAAKGLVLASQETFLKGGPFQYNGTTLSA